MAMMPSVIAIYEGNLKGKCARCCICCLKCRKKKEHESNLPQGAKVDNKEEKNTPGQLGVQDLEDPNRPNSRDKFKPKIILPD